MKYENVNYLPKNLNTCYNDVNKNIFDKELLIV